MKNGQSNVATITQRVFRLESSERRLEHACLSRWHSVEIQLTHTTLTAAIVHERHDRSDLVENITLCTSNLLPRAYAVSNPRLSTFDWRFFMLVVRRPRDSSVLPKVLNMGMAPRISPSSAPPIPSLPWNGRPLYTLTPFQH